MSRPQPPLADLGRILARLGRHAIVSHTTAASVWQLDQLSPPDRIEITMPRGSAGPYVAGVTIHRSDITAEDVAMLVPGEAVTSLARTSADLALTLPFEEGVVTVDSALRPGEISVQDIRLRCRGRRGAPKAKAVLDFADPWSASEMETVLRVWFHEVGVPRPVTQYPVCDARRRRIMFADFAWPALRLVVETDGFEYHSDRRDLLLDRHKANALLRAGWHLMRFGYEDVMGRGEHCARQVLWATRRLASGTLWVPGGRRRRAAACGCPGATPPDSPES